MKDTARTVSYFAMMIDDKPGEGTRLTKEIAKQGINLLAVHGFPAGAGKSQIDIVPEDPQAFTRAAKSMGMNLGQPKTAFLIQGDDRVGAVADMHGRLAQAGINMIAATTIAAGSGRYGGILWVAQKDVEAAARALDAGVLTR